MATAKTKSNKVVCVVKHGALYTPEKCDAEGKIVVPELWLRAGELVELSDEQVETFASYVERAL